MSTDDLTPIAKYCISQWDNPRTRGRYSDWNGVGEPFEVQIARAYLARLDADDRERAERALLAAIAERGGVDRARGDVVFVARATVHHVAKELLADAPTWHDAPTGPGMWLFPPQMVLTTLAEKDLTSRYWRMRCFGPIPPQQEPRQ